LEEDELPIPKKIFGPEMRQKMTAARIALGLNQQQLATQCAFPASVIRDIENGRIVPTGAQLNTLNRLLGGGLRLEERK
jgi:ribosome-binding protein aMBF1 (putative translation factor)